MKKIMILITFSLMVFTGVYASNEKGGTKSAGFIQLGIGARALGMSGAYMGMEGDIYSAYWNPAGLTNLNEINVGLMHVSLPESINQEYIILGMPLVKNKSYIALTFNFGKYGEEDVTVYPDLNGNDYTTDETFDGSDLMIALSYAFKMSENVSFGVNGKYISQSIYNYDANALAIDFSMLYKLNEIVSWGSGIYNIGSKMKFDEKEEELPLTFKTGFAFNPLENRMILINGDLSYVKDEDLGYALGLEFNIYKGFSLRGGFNSVNDADNGYTLGLGFKVGNLNLDYSYEPYGVFDDSHKFSLDYAFKPVTLNQKRIVETREKENIVKLSVEEMMKKGYYYVMENDYFSAIFNFYDVLNEEPSNINARLWVAYILTKLGDTNKAIEEYHKVLRMDPFNSNAKKALSLLEKR